MKKLKVRQGTLTWEKLKLTRIGSSEVFDIVKYYALPDELQNCGINPEQFRAEKPYTTVWALYHKLINDGQYKKEALAPEYAEYGHAAEPYGRKILQQGRKKRLRPGEVYVDDKYLIASLDISGTAEETDVVPFDYGNGRPMPGQRFVCEQKTMMPQMMKNGLPFKYIIQAQYQILQTKADFFILQVMTLKDDTVFNRGRICGMSKQKRFEYFDENMTVKNIYFRNNIQLSRLIETCLDRFFHDVEKRKEPTPYIEYDTQQNIIESIRLNALFNNSLMLEYDLTAYNAAKSNEELYGQRKKEELQKIVEAAKANNACRFLSPDGFTAVFDKRGRFLVRKKESEEAVS